MKKRFSGELVLVSPQIFKDAERMSMAQMEGVIKKKLGLTLDCVDLSSIARDIVSGKYFYDNKNKLKKKG
jgi:hypothetical protein